SAAKLLREFYFDVALSSGPSALPSLLGFADPARITYGTDYPYAPAELAAGFGHSYERYVIDADLRGAIDRGNAETLFPRLTSIQS
ncbi:MAG: amidohydrolase 2, partial [Streptosporangiaceae bacterium]|nr:amidohydrolase 2 [Streptosporangiaceae bacterium]